MKTNILKLDKKFQVGSLSFLEGNIQQSEVCSTSRQLFNNLDKLRFLDPRHVLMGFLQVLSHAMLKVLKRQLLRPSVD